MAKDLAECLKLQTESDGLEGYLVVHPGYDRQDVTAEILRIQLQAAGVVSSWIDKKSLKDISARCQGDSDTVHRALVAVGAAPTHGLAGSFEAHESIRQRQLEISHRQKSLDELDGGSALDDDQATDFRSQSAYIFIKKDQEIGVLIPPTDGLDGQDIFGATIAARRGPPSPMELGSGVQLDEDQIVRADTHGVLKLSSLNISVDETLHIDGAVDYSTGNISFSGSIEVSKEVQDCFVVEAEGSVHIRGLVQAATIHTDRELILEGGMAGREKGVLYAGGGLSARYLDAVTGVVHGVCTIRNEINSCELLVHGHFDSPEAALRGGRSVATMGMTIGVLGGAGGITTEVLIGHLAEPERLIARTFDLIQELEGSAADAMTRLDQLKSNLAKITATQAEELTELEFEASHQGKLLASMRQKLVQLTELVEASTKHTLKIMRRACPGAKIWFPGFLVEIRRELKGPVEILLDQDGQIQLIDVNSGSSISTTDSLSIVEDLTVLPVLNMESLESAA
jgi:uncharacterized protein